MNTSVEKVEKYAVQKNLWEIPTFGTTRGLLTVKNNYCDVYRSAQNIVMSYSKNYP